MTAGIMEVVLVEAKGLRGADLLFDKIDPYVVIHYKGQERKSSVARGQGSNPRWNEKFTFRAEYPGSGSNFNLLLKLMDKDTFSADDFLGQATICWKQDQKMGVQRRILPNIVLFKLTSLTVAKLKLNFLSNQRVEDRFGKTKRLGDGKRATTTNRREDKTTYGSINQSKFWSRYC